MSPDLQHRVREALALLQRGDAAAASEALRPALRAAPRDPNVRHLAGLIRRAQGDLLGALTDFDAALTAAPNAARMHFNRASLLAALGRHIEALDGFEAAARLGIDDAPLWRARGVALSHLNRHAEAVAAFDRVLALEPGASDDRANRARALLADGRYLDAIADYDVLLQQYPNDAGLWDNRGVALFKLDQLDAAEVSLKNALELRPDHASTVSNLGLTLFGLGKAEAAVAAFDRALSLEGGSDNGTVASLHYNRGMAALALGDFGSGWGGLEHRWAAGMVNAPRLDKGERAWNGERVDGALRIWPEQGIGDQILFARLVPLARARAVQVILECEPRLAPLLARSFPDLEVSPETGQPALAQCPVGSLGAIMNVQRDDLAGGTAFMRADASAVERFRARYAAMADGRPIIGIAWSSISPGRGEWKTAALSHWGSLLQRDAFFVSLQYGDTRADIEAARVAFGVEIYTDETVDQFQDLDMFAAQIAALDNVVSVSNTTVHMAGALGVDCIVMPPPARGRLWYWSIDGDTTPWYNSVRIVRRALDETWTDQATRAAALLPLSTGARVT